MLDKTLLNQNVPTLGDGVEKMLPLGHTPEGEKIKGRLVITAALTDPALMQVATVVNSMLLAELERRGVIPPAPQMPPPGPTDAPPAEETATAPS